MEDLTVTETTSTRIVVELPNKATVVVEVTADGVQSSISRNGDAEACVSCLAPWASLDRAAP